MSGAADRAGRCDRQLVDTPCSAVVAAQSRLSRFDRPIAIMAAADAVLVVGGAHSGVISDIGQLPRNIALFFVGAFVMRGAGCT
jgi:4-hydroxybenzoate polyprenyltransferase